MARIGSSSKVDSNMAAVTREDIRTISRDELRPDIERLQEEVNRLRESNVRAAEANSEAIANIAKAVERMSLIVVGDESLRVEGVIDVVRKLQDARQATMLERAKISGIWLGASTVAIIVGKTAWHVLDYVFKTP